MGSEALLRLLPKYRCESGGIFAVYPSRKNPTAALKVFLDSIIANDEVKQKYGLIAQKQSVIRNAWITRVNGLIRKG
jgi:hypothetical protein